jgi:DNA polymerase I-like protein with 3'-5' exonuclease and polymerase domains
MDASVRLAPRLKAFGTQLALSVHDALVYVIADQFVPQAGAIMKEEMNRRPAWSPDLPLACDLKAGQTYGDAK